MRQGDIPGAIRHFFQSSRDLGALHHHLEFNLERARSRWLASRVGSSPSVAVCGWELAHNAVGRVMTLVEAYQGHASVEMIGCLFPFWGRQLWQPIRSTRVPCHSFVVESESEFIRQALDLVTQHPYDLVHLSKPRFPNIVFGFLYKLIWGARVVMDIDDEELGFVRATEPLSWDSFCDVHGVAPAPKNLRGKDWTRLAVGLAGRFDGVTVSNPALQERYGGRVMPHVRPESRFQPSLRRTRESRQKFRIPQDKTVVLFYGTPREHKGLLDTARALASLDRDDVCYVVAGDFPDPGLKKRLQAVDGVECYFIGNQPYESAADVLAVGDCCVLLQNADSLAAQYQVPAKLTDALAMGLTVFGQETPALQDLARAGGFVPITRETLPAALCDHLSRGAEWNFACRGRQVFEERLSTKAVASEVSELLRLPHEPLPHWSGRLEPLTQGRVSFLM